MIVVLSIKIISLSTLCIACICYIFFRMGKLLREISDPGVHYRFPLTTEYHVLQVTMQTDKVLYSIYNTGHDMIAIQTLLITVLSNIHVFIVLQVVNIPCGTSGKYMLFPNIDSTQYSHTLNVLMCSGGIMIYFDKIEVVNRLKKEFVFDTVKNYSIHYDQNQIFSKIHRMFNIDVVACTVIVLSHN